MNRVLRQFPFLAALLPQLMLAVLAPTLVICQEGTGAQVLEFTLSDCCDDVDSDLGDERLELGPDEEECGDCQDAALAISLQRDGQRTTLELLAAPVCLQEIPSLWVPSATHACAPPTRDLRPDPGLRALRTVRLRC